MDRVDAGRRPFDVVLCGISVVILFAASVPSFLPKFARVVAVLFVGYIYYQIIFTQTFGDFAVDLPMGSVILAQYLQFADYALFTSPDDLVDYCNRDSSQVTRRPLRKRVQWTLRLFSNPRGIGWAHEPSPLPPRPSPSTPRRRFVLSRILYVIGCFCGIGVAYVVNASNPGLTTPGMLLSEAPLHWRALGVTCFGLGAVFSISGTNSIMSTIVVGCGYSSPERWPRLFGSPLEIWSVKRFWRRFWHQGIRNILLKYPSMFMQYVFPAIKPESMLYKLARLYLAFFVSGVIHMAGDAMVTGKIIFKAFTFFMLQPFGITIELVVAHLWRQLSGSQDKISAVDRGTGPTKSKVDGNRKRPGDKPVLPLWIRCAGFIWVALWMAWTAPYIVDPLCAVGVFTDPRVDLRRLL